MTVTALVMLLKLDSVVEVFTTVSTIGVLRALDPRLLLLILGKVADVEFCSCLSRVSSLTKLSPRSQ